MIAQGPLCEIIGRVSVSHIAWHPVLHWSVTPRESGQIRILDVDNRREWHVSCFRDVLEFFGPDVSADPGWQLL
jgi:hypothetical protein